MYYHQTLTQETERVSPRSRTPGKLTGMHSCRLNWGKSLLTGGTGSPLRYLRSQPAPSPPCHAAASVLLLRQNNIRTAMRKTNSLLWRMCPHSVRTFSQQRATTNFTFIGTRFHWPCFFGDLTPFILFWLQLLQFPADKAFITAHLPQQKHAAKKNIQACKAKGQSPSCGPS